MVGYARISSGEYREAKKAKTHIREAKPHVRKAIHIFLAF
jgi:hypothetical protein